MKAAQRQSRRQRKRSPGLRLVERDFEILLAVAAHHYMTIEMVQTLCFSVSSGYKAAARRLRALHEAGLLARRYTPTFGAQPAIYMPSKAGIDLLLDHQWITPEEVDWRRKHNHITEHPVRHELAVNRLIVAVMRALAERYHLWRDEACPHRDGGKRTVRRIDQNRLSEWVVVERGSHLWDTVQNPDRVDSKRYPNLAIRPDRFLVVKEADHFLNFFLEVELAAKNRHRLKRRMRAYRAYYRSGGFLRRYGQGDDRSRYPFTVLVTTPTEERRNNLVELAIGEQCLRCIWFAVYDEVLANPLGAVWVRGEEYQNALSTLPDAERGRQSLNHRRRERDAFVRKHVAMRSLMNG